MRCEVELGLEIRWFKDEDGNYINFHSDVRQDLVDSLGWLLFWHDVKHTLIDWGYTVIEINIENEN